MVRPTPTSASSIGARIAKVAAAQAVNDPALPDPQRELATITGLRNTLFQGETSRGLLLTSFGFSDLGEEGGSGRHGCPWARRAGGAPLSSGLGFGLWASGEAPLGEEPVALIIDDQQLIGV